MNSSNNRYILILTASVFVSGFSALLYQVVWQRMLGLFSGSDVRSVTIVASAFLAGLGVGSLAGSILADRFSSRGAVRFFGWCNIGIGIFAACSRFLYYDVLFRELNALAEGPALLLVIVFISLLIPTTLMGLSLPLLSRAIVRDIQDAARLISRLYAMNLFGAAAGTVISGWYLIGTLGYDVSVYIGAGLSLAAGILALVMSGRFAGDDASHASAANARISLRSVPRSVWIWGFLVFASGFIAISLEIIWFRILDVTLKSNAYTFAHVLAFFLIGDAAGNWTGSRLVHRVTNPRRAFLWIQGLLALYALVSVWTVMLAADAHPLATYIATTSGKLNLTLEDNRVQWFIYFALPAALMLPPSFLIGFYFPVVQKAVQTDSAVVGQRVGLIDMCNIIGNTTGGIVAGLVILHFLGTAASLQVIGVLGLIFTLVLTWESRRRISSGILAAALLATVIAYPGNARLWAALHGTQSGDPFYVAEDSSGVSAIRRGADADLIYANGQDQGRIPFSDIHAFLGALPALVHPNPQHILVIGIGSAGTPSAAGLNPATESIIAVEIIGAELDVLREYAESENVNVIRHFLDDPRYTIIIGDGRRELAFSDTAFDIIEADAIRPVSSHSGLLYSREYFEQARDKLAEGGIMAQWNPTFRVQATFAAVFPYVIYVPPVLLGSRSPIPYDVDVILARLDEPEIRAYLDMIQVDIDTLRDLIQPPTMEWTPDTPRDVPDDWINTDLFPRDEYYLNNGG